MNNKKRYLFLLILVVLIFGIGYIFFNPKDTKVDSITYDIELNIEESKLFSKEEVNNAIQGLRDEFKLHCPDGILLKVQFDDITSDFYADEHLRLFPKKKLKKENVISFLLDFEIGESDNNFLPAYSILHSYPCVLSKDRRGNWTIEAF